MKSAETTISSAGDASTRDPAAAPAGAAVEAPSWSALDWAGVTVATFFGTGKMPVAPGTWGSLATVLIYVLCLTGLSTVALVALTVVVSALGIASASLAERALHKHDPGEVVIDEVAGQLIAVLPVHYLGLVSPEVLVVAFLTFRVFDVLKPYPCYQLQSLPRGWGVMCDDLVAGVYAAALTWGSTLILARPAAGG